MTPEQKRWLDANAPYEIVTKGGVVPGGGLNFAMNHTKTGTLLLDGTFRLGARIASAPTGSILVGIRPTAPQSVGRKISGNQ